MERALPTLTLTATWDPKTKSWAIDTWVQRDLGVISHSVRAVTTTPMERADARWLASALRDHLEGKLDF